MRFTNDSITQLQENEIFVFGSNYKGVHGAGAAKVAMTLFGAEFGIGVGPTGQCYALPTKSADLETLSLDQIREEINRFDRHIQAHPDKLFLITKIGCGLAGYTFRKIAPLFEEIAIKYKNIALPKKFWRIIDPYNTLAFELNDICEKNKLGRDWESGGVYLHLEVSEFIESLRGKKGDPIDEAADVLFVLLAMLSHHAIDLHSVIRKVLSLRDTV